METSWVFSPGLQFYQPNKVGHVVPLQRFICFINDLEPQETPTPSAKRYEFETRCVQKISATIWIHWKGRFFEVETKLFSYFPCLRDLHLKHLLPCQGSDLLCVGEKKCKFLDDALRGTPASLRVCICACERVTRKDTPCFAIGPSLCVCVYLGPLRFSPRLHMPPDPPQSTWCYHF